MKNYYYFLGIPTDASDDEIKKAYRKLSLKYHPDKNENDEFFSERFKEIVEAYETLIDVQSRKLYDDNLLQNTRSYKPTLPPIIKTFTSNKTDVVKGEEIIIKWNTQNADVVKILPFGLEKSYGERVFKITEFVDGKFHVIVHATNTHLNKTVVLGLTIQENRLQKGNQEDSFDNKITNQKDSEYNMSLSTKIILFLVIIVALIAIISVYF